MQIVVITIWIILIIIVQGENNKALNKRLDIIEQQLAEIKTQLKT